MKNVTISMPEDQLEAVRRIAETNATTLNELVRKWSADYVAKQRAEQTKALKASWKKLDYVRLERKYTREEMNER